MMKGSKRNHHIRDQVEPAPLDVGWHVECLCEHLEAVAHQQCLRLLITCRRAT